MASDRVASSTLSLCTVLSDDSVSIEIQNAGNNHYYNGDDTNDDQGPGSFIEIVALSEVTNDIINDYDSDSGAEFELINHPTNENVATAQRCDITMLETPTLNSNCTTRLINQSQYQLENNHNSDEEKTNHDDESVKSLSLSSSQALSFFLDSSLSSAPSIRHNRHPTPDESFMSETTIIQEGDAKIKSLKNEKKKHESNVIKTFDTTDDGCCSNNNKEVPINDTPIGTNNNSMSCSGKPPYLIGSFRTNDSDFTETESELLSSQEHNRMRRKGDNNTSNTMFASALATTKSISNILLGVAVSAVVVAGAILVQAFVTSRRSRPKDDDDNN